jgi:AcrR family transcriptional regulator
MSTKPGTELALAGTADGDRRAAILAAALDIFMRYGFNRATMEDIAREAGISRPALYRDFRNKADIYKALAANLLDRAASAAEEVLAGTGPLEQRLARAIDVGLLDHIIAISQSPHGAEIIEQKAHLTDDVIAGWRRRMEVGLARAIAEAAQTRGIKLKARGLAPQMLAQSMLDGLDGAKYRSKDPAEWRRAAAGFVKLVTLALA